MKKLIIIMTVSLIFFSACGSSEQNAPIQPQYPIFDCSDYDTSGHLYLDAFNTLYQTHDTRLNCCSTCHDPYAIFNPYGYDLLVELKITASVESALVNIESLDSDNDGYENIEEIQALTYPGFSNDYP